LKQGRDIHKTGLRDITLGACLLARKPALLKNETTWQFQGAESVVSNKFATLL